MWKFGWLDGLDSWLVFPAGNYPAAYYYLLTLDALAWACFDVCKSCYDLNFRRPPLAGCASKLAIKFTCWPPVLRNVNVFG